MRKAGIQEKETEIFSSCFLAFLIVLDLLQNYCGATSTVSGLTTPTTTTFAPVGSNSFDVTAWYSTVRFCTFRWTLPTPAFCPGTGRYTVPVLPTERS